MTRLFALTVPLTLLLVGCSKPPLIVQVPPLPANLSQLCGPVPKVPNPLIDPDRAQWEADVVYAYMDCAARHRATVEAWKATQPKR